MERVVLHSDLNNFYASVECLYHPELRDKPVVVGGDEEKRHGIVLAKNYIAKRYGIKTGETLWNAKQKCPNLISMPPNFERYLEFSKLVKEIYSRYTDKVESFGLDECWLDVSNSTNLFGNGKKIADEIRKTVKFELGVTVSVGVSFNKIFSKLGSDMKKPDATTVISRDNFKNKVWALPVEDLLYVGRSTHRKLKEISINTIGQLANTNIELLNSKFGKIGNMLWSFANGIDDSPVTNISFEEQIKSIGNSTTTPKDLVSEEDVKIILYLLCESVAMRLREKNLTCNTIQISLRDNELLSFERQCKLAHRSNVSEDIFESAYSLYRNNKPIRPIRSIGVRACNLSIETEEQISFLPGYIKSQNKLKIEKTIDNIRKRFGYFSIQRGIMLLDTELSNLDAKSEHVIHPVNFLK